MVALPSNYCHPPGGHGNVCFFSCFGYTGYTDDSCSNGPRAGVAPHSPGMQQNNSILATDLHTQKPTEIYWCFQIEHSPRFLLLCLFSLYVLYLNGEHYNAEKQCSSAKIMGQR